MCVCVSHYGCMDMCAVRLIMQRLKQCDSGMIIRLGLRLQKLKYLTRGGLQPRGCYSRHPANHTYIPYTCTHIALLLSMLPLYFSCTGKDQFALYLCSVLASPFKQGGPPSSNFGSNHFLTTFNRVIPSLFRYFE